VSRAQVCRAAADDHGVNDKQAPSGFLQEFVTFVRHNKKLWLVPLAIVLVLLVTALLLSQSGALAPFMYSPS
jgi:hypothetical protein